MPRLQVAALHFVEQGDENARAGCADGMADGDRAAVDVDLFGIRVCSSRVTAMACTAKASLSSYEVDVLVAVPAGFLQNFFDGLDRRHHHPFGLDAADGLRDDARHGLLCRGAAALRSLVTTTAAAPSLVPGALPAVTVPSFLNAARSLARASSEVSSRGDSSLLMTMGAPFFCGISMGTICASKKQDFMARTAF